MGCNWSLLKNPREQDKLRGNSKLHLKKVKNLESHPEHWACHPPVPTSEPQVLSILVSSCPVRLCVRVCVRVRPCVFVCVCDVCPFQPPGPQEIPVQALLCLASSGSKLELPLLAFW